MSQRRYNNRPLNVNPTMVGVGSTTSESAWVGDVSYGWHTAVSSGALVDNAEYVQKDGAPCLKLQVSNLDRSGGTQGLAFVTNADQYSANPIGETSRPYLIPVKAGASYAFSGEVFVESITAGCKAFVGHIPYSNARARLTIPNDTILTDTVGSWVTTTATITMPYNTSYVVIRAGAIAVTDPTTDGTAVFYVRNVYLQEILPDRLPLALPRLSLAMPRKVVYDSGYALNFENVTTDKVVMPNALPFITQEGIYSVAFSMRPNTDFASGVHMIWNYSGSTNNRNGFSVRYGQLAFSRYNGTVYTYTGTTNFRRVMNKKTNVVCVNDGGTMKLYLDGELVTSDITIENYLNAVVTNKMQIGYPGSTTNNSQAFKGDVDDFRVWDIALTPDEVADLHYNNHVQRNDLVGEWLFNEGEGTTALDTSGNGNHGTISGATYVSGFNDKRITI